MMIENFEPFMGEHCESTATGNLLKHIGADISEAMILGLGEGLSFLLFPIKQLNLPFVGGRIKTFEITQNLCRNLGLELKVKETSSIKKAWQNVKEVIESGNPAGLQLDSYHLEYFTKKIHFAGHFAAMYGFDDEYAYLVDTSQQGGAVKTKLQNLTDARSEKGPMSARNRSYSITHPGKLPALKKVILNAVKNNATEYLNPPIKNFTYKGIEKFSKQVKNWFDICEDPKTELVQVGTLMERAGTGGSIFRNLYRDFLYEAYDLTKSVKIKNAADMFADVALKWKECADLFDKAGSEENPLHLDTISKILSELSVSEKKAMEILSGV
jgi:hypothetical protein